mmetsp:Transcript_127291/g.249427  ORF Transcript_127291/g.249427 Transcript_127291/m.249427 type:complete len:303 (-) Transcript_127291:19-927(-)
MGAGHMERLPQLCWPTILSHLPLRTWWRCRWTSSEHRASFDGADAGGHGEGMLRLALQLWPLEVDDVHGGVGGVQLTDVVRTTMRLRDVRALVAICAELRRRGRCGLPWQLTSRELFLYAASHSDYPEPMSVILGLAPGAMLAECSKRGYTALHEAVFARQARNVEALLSWGFNARSTNNVGETALHIACFGVSAAGATIVEHLLAHDAGLAAIADEMGRLPLDRFWEALARAARAEKQALVDDRRWAAEHVLALLDPSGASTTADPERPKVLEVLGAETAKRGPEVQVQSPPRRRARQGRH